MLNRKEHFNRFVRTIFSVALCASIVVVAGCDDDDETDPAAANAEEVITTLNLTFTPNGGGPVQNAQFRDADGDGGNPPTVTGITLQAGVTYTLDMALLNETVPASEPEYNIGDEIAEEAEEHQFFFTGTAVGNLVSVAYDDVESNYTQNTVGADLPVGLRASVAANNSGSGDFVVTLKHQPPVNGQPVKTANSGINDGETDIEVSFPITVQ